VSQLVGLIDPHPVNDFTPVFGHHMEQLVDDLGLRTQRPDLQLVGCGHVDRDRFDACGDAFWKLFEEGPGCLTGAAPSDPQHLPADRIHYHRGVPVTFMERKLVHRQIADRRPVRLGHARTQTHFVDRFDRVPAQIVEGRHCPYAGRLQQLLARFGKALGHPLVAAQSPQLLQSQCSHQTRWRGTCSTTRYSNSCRSRTRRTVVS